jgi:hypothetical protein
VSIFGAGADVVGKVVTKYEADTSQQIAELKKLKGEQRKQAQEAIDGVNKQAEAWDALKTRGAIALAGLTAAFAIGKAGFEAYHKSITLGAGTAGVDLDRLSQAAGGLKTNMELLQFAAAAMNGRFRLTQAEMETVLKSMSALERSGLAAADVSQKLGDAIRKGEVEPLKELGVAFDETTAKTDKQRAFLDALSKSGKNVGESLPTDDIRKMGVEFRNSFDTIQQNIGKLVVALSPLVAGIGDVAGATIQATGEIIKMAAAIAALPRNIGSQLPGVNKLANRQSDGWNVSIAAMLAGNLLGEEGWTKVSKALGSRSGNVAEYGPDGLWSGGAVDIDAMNAEIQALRDRFAADAEEEAASGPDLTSRVKMLQAAAAQSKFYRDQIKKKRTGGGRARGGDEWSLWDRAKFEIDQLAYRGSRIEQPSGMSEYGASLLGGLSGGEGVDGADPERLARMLGEAEDRSASLEKIFGPVSEFEAYATGFKLLETAASSAFDAWMTGAKGVGAAMKEAVAGFAKSLAIEALMQALRHGAYALGSLAFGDVRGATAHGISAAKWGAVAVVAGVAAKGLGGGIGAGGGASAGGYSARGGLASGGGEGRNVTIVLGGSADGESPRSNSRRVARALAVAEQHGYSARPPGVEFS